MGRLSDLHEQRDRVRAERYEMDLPKRPEGEDRVNVDLMCPRCEAWLYPTAIVGERSGHKATEHDVRCGCHAALQKSDPAAAARYIEQLEQLVSEQMIGGLDASNAYNVPGASFFDRCERTYLSNRKAS